MPDCDHPKCHEHMVTELKDKVSWVHFQKLRDCVHKKTPKSWLWTGFVIVGLPLLITGAKVWSETSHNSDKYMTREEMLTHVTDIVKCKENTKHMSEVLKEIQAGQRETRQDVKEILKILAR